MNNETIGYTPKILAEMPKSRQETRNFNNINPENIPNNLDYAISRAFVRRLSK